MYKQRLDKFLLTASSMYVTRTRLSSPQLCVLTSQLEAFCVTGPLSRHYDKLHHIGNLRLVRPSRDSSPPFNQKYNFTLVKVHMSCVIRSSHPSWVRHSMEHVSYQGSSDHYYCLVFLTRQQLSRSEG